MKLNEIKNKKLRDFVSKEMSWIIRRGEICIQDYEDIPTIYLTDDYYLYKIYTFNTTNTTYVDVFKKNYNKDGSREYICTEKYTSGLARELIF